MVASSGALQLPLHQIESQQQAKGREVQRLLLQAHLQHRGDGDLGPALQLHQQDGEVLYSHRRLGTRSRTTVFGTVELVRMGYSRPSTPGIFPLDKALALLVLLRTPAALYLDVSVPAGRRKKLPVETTRHAFAYVFGGNGTFCNASGPLDVPTEAVGRSDAAPPSSAENRSLVLFDTGDEVELNSYLLEPTPSPPHPP